MKKIEVLFPEVANLYGDLMNVEYLRRCLGDAEVTQTYLKDRPLFADEKPDLIFMGSVTELGQKLAIDALTPYKDRLQQLIDEGVIFLITGNACEIFWARIESDEAPTVQGLGLFPYVAKLRMMNRFNGYFLGTFGSDKIVGFKSQFGHTYGEGTDEGLFPAIRGVGRNPDEPTEGIRRNNFMATYLTGPLLVMNPPFTKYLLGLMGEADRPLPCEEAAMASYKLRIEEFSQTNRACVYH